MALNKTQIEGYDLDICNSAGGVKPEAKGKRIVTWQ
jgi:hypothetical protein